MPRQPWIQTRGIDLLNPATHPDPAAVQMSDERAATTYPRDGELGFHDDGPDW
jgi:hypothetical protein